MEKVKLEINFYEIKPRIQTTNYSIKTSYDLIVKLSIKQEVSVFIESKLTDLDDENYVEILIFSLFATRQISNFGVADKIAHNLCGSLIRASEEIINLTKANYQGIIYIRK